MKTVILINKKSILRQAVFAHEYIMAELEQKIYLVLCYERKFTLKRKEKSLSTLFCYNSKLFSQIFWVRLGPYMSNPTAVNHL